jgi:NAD(P)H-nitrite reductase large subunit
MRNRLVVVGNGMAGARLLEDLVKRGGRDLFDMTVFGEESCGNYNRILLSGVLSRSHQPDAIFLMVCRKRHHAPRRTSGRENRSGTEDRACGRRDF